MSLRETINNTSVADRIIFIVLLLVSLTGIFFIKDVLPDGADVRIEVGNNTKYRYPLYNNRLINIAGPNGHLTVEIKDRKVRVIHASCPNKLCERQGWIKAGAIICLPNRISVIVGGYGNSKNREFDAISG